MAKKPKPKKPKPIDPRETDSRDLIHPREAANAIEEKCLFARIKSGRGAKIQIAVHDAFIIAKLLRLVPLKRGSQPKTTQQDRHFRMVVEKARRRKEGLVADDKKKKKLDAEHEAAQWASKGTPWKAETIARAMHNKDE